MGKKSGNSTTQTVADAQTQDYMKQVWGAASGAAAAPGVGVNAATTDALHGFQGFATAGNLGLGALSGNPEMMKAFMDPYQSGVIKQMRDQYGIQRQGVSQSINDAATQAGAFGGSRHGVAEGVAQAGLARDQDQQMAGLLDQGFNNSMGRAGQVANLGFGATGAMGGIGDYMHGIDVQNDPNMRKMQFLQNAFGLLPHGSTTTGTQQNGKSPLNGAIGGATIGAKFGPWGAGIGGVLGGLGGLFG